MIIIITYYIWILITIIIIILLLLRIIIIYPPAYRLPPPTCAGNHGRGKNTNGKHILRAGHSTSCSLYKIIFTILLSRPCDILWCTIYQPYTTDVALASINLSNSITLSKLYRSTYYINVCVFFVVVEGANVIVINNHIFIWVCDNITYNRL